MINIYSNRIEARTAYRDAISSNVEEFLSNGGKITHISTRSASGSKTFEKRHRPSKRYARAF